MCSSIRLKGRFIFLNTGFFNELAMIYSNVVCSLIVFCSIDIIRVEEYNNHI